MKTKSKANQVEIGAKWSRHSYGEVIGKSYPDGIQIRNEQGLEWTITQSIFEAEFTVADQYDKTETITRTEMVERIMASARLAMTVFFRKKPEHKTLVDTVFAMLGIGEAPTKRKLSKILKNATAGEERTLVGRHYGNADDFGRLRFTEYGKGPRLVDPRTVEWCIVNRVRYEVR